MNARKNIRLDPDVNDLADQLAKQDGRTKTNFVNHTLRQAFGPGHTKLPVAPTERIRRPSKRIAREGAK